ncbi:hypothetical protein BAUCODRAFT_29413 [Baudoinia panamericana UAMH 10762]|uniref:Uncharacterized protein n=1 Tax=Baudoinia panamericana (strain UAMH 10762) TaxID=717646 RepID=M2NNG1_BAUPA|nr:uncharacterized protein BAUCODRAFT_29413 [Baudoinia panamericana UAMH 10762]EMD01030.1 hypothetical protein BAUCODRAFT_29413 [Baudoinia panamericana UAMH 10762]
MAFSSAATITWSRIKAMSFDIYGTLIDWEGGIDSSARGTALGPYLPRDHRQLMLDIEKHDTAVQKEHPTMLQRDVIAEGLKRYAKELRIVEDGKLSQAEVDKACKQYGGKIGEYPAFPDTVAAIQRLAKHYKLIPLTNVDNESFSRTLSGPLSGCKFDAYYTAEDIGSYKPDLKNFHYLLDHLKKDFDVEQADICHVAQSLFHDHGPARDMHIQSVWVDRQGFMGGEVENAQDRFAYQLRVENLGELAQIVDKAFEAS